MTDADIIALTREAIWVLLIVSAPLLIIAMAVGLAISFVQALTQIQEATISFVPKILILFVAMIVLLPFMTQRLVDFGQSLQPRIIAVGQSEAP
jgi:flagellar biosynthesis protein FliQ